MAILEPLELARLRQCLDKCTDPILLAAADDECAPEESLRGVLGVIDWRVHGHISKLLTRNEMAGFSLIPGQRKLGKASLLMMNSSPKSLAKLPETLRKLSVDKICLVESSFGEKDLPKVQESLRKAQVSWNRLESLA